MTDFRRLTGAFVAAIGLILSAPYAFAQQPDRGDEPGLVADDSYRARSGMAEAGRLLPHDRSAGHHHHLDH